MPQKAADLKRRLESLELDLRISKQQFVLSHERLASATKHLGKAIRQLSRPNSGGLKT